uniref:Eco57I restriction-modification methylase domain-containing protein n=1 Tax=Haloarcula sediminis TaxID=3111777 RepID=UPI002D77C6B0|nr:TaqI-like C-terminal specificity domain-containing protein [Haloarcula sp. CK38]
MQTPLTYWTNRDLFSNYYLTEHLPETEVWNELTDDELREAKADIMELWERERETAPKRNESQLEEKFIRPMFRKLGIPFEVAERTSETQRRPDYGFFASADAARGAFGRRENGGDFYRDAVAVADAKRWGRPLDTRGKKQRDFENPSHQIDQYLRFTSTTWGVLTNGKRWRLYYRPTSHKLDSYYEIDLPTVLEKGDLAEFKYFYLFFRHSAFLEDATGDSFLDDVYNESNVFAQELGEDLQDNIYEAIKVLSEGFLQYPDNELSADDLDRIHDSSLIYLYRLIFVLYAESEGRNLLDTNNEIYAASYSLNALKQDIADELDSSQPRYRAWQDTLWDRLDELFKLIDQGSKSRDIPVEDLYIPAYNGGLFRTDIDDDDSVEARFLANHKVGDAYLAEVIELLTRSQNGDGGGKIFVDYSSLDVRHLGSIYEGLLEYQLDIAEEPLALDDGEYVPAQEDDEVIVTAGEVYLLTGSGDRKATGSYYTPEAVVEYIVEETLEPLVDDIRSDLVGQNAVDEGGFAEEFAEAVFDLKILDPAMGSGHFLTSAVDYLAREIIDAQERQAAQRGIETVDKAHDINWARRQVAQRCIYGVDLNPLAVELAKVSLWLRTLAAEQPLAFLDHHLKTGNSLVGSDIEEIEKLESDASGGGQNATLADFGVARKGTIEQLMRIYQDFIAIENRELADIKEIEAKYDEFERNKLRRRLEGMANVHTAEQFGLDTLPGDAYKRMAAALEDDAIWNDIEQTQWFQDAQRWAQMDSYFHWKLEFPELYYDAAGHPLPAQGFDAVIGNPPWVATAGRADISANIDTDLRAYLAEEFTTAENQFDLYVAFYEQSVRQSQSGRVGIIVPDAVLTREQNKPIREFVLSNTSLSEIVRVGTAFEGVETGAVILVSSGTVEQIRCADTPSVTDLPSLDYNQIPNRVFKTQEAKRFLIYLDGETRSILEKVENNPPLKNHISISRGEEISKRADFLFENQQSNTRPIAPGGAIIRYGIDEEELRYVEQTDVQKARENYQSPKLVFRQTSDSLVGTFDTEDLVTIKSAYNIHSNTDSVDELKHVLGILNSAVLNFYHHYKHAAYRSVFPQINQSTFEAFPVPIGEAPDEVIINAVNELLDLTGDRSQLNLRVEDYLGTYEFGSSIDELPGCQPSDGVSASKLAATTDEWPNLKIGTVTVEETGSAIVLTATARYKPDSDAVETDRWGYAETEPIPAVEFVGLDTEYETLVETFVPYATETAGGFANFRENATTSKSLYDRLSELQLPRVADVERGLQQFIDRRERADELDDRIEDARLMLEERVCDLYGLTDEERTVVKDEFIND